MLKIYGRVVSGKGRRHFGRSEGGEQIGFAILCHFANSLSFNKDKDKHKHKEKMMMIIKSDGYDNDDDVGEGAVRQLGNTCPQPLRCTVTILLKPQRLNISLKMFLL